MGIEPDKELIWKYIRGECTDSEKIYIESLIKNDKEVSAHYKRLIMYQQFLNSSEERQNPDVETDDNSEDPSYNPYYLAFWILIIVFVLLAIYSTLK